MTKVSVIGSGFSSLAASCYLASAGFEVDVYEKNDSLGGRARQLVRDGFKFDMGPSWYWMPDVFERFFGDFDKRPSDYYQLERLSPAYRVYFGKDDYVDIPDRPEKIVETFEQIEAGSSAPLNRFLSKAAQNYDTAISELVYKPGLSPLELVTRDTVTELRQFVRTITQDVRKGISSPKLQQILEFPVLFLGAKPSNTPAFYSFMNHADFGLGTWYPKGGMKSVVDGIIKLAEELGVRFHTNAAIENITVGAGRQVEGLSINGELIESSLVVSGADYHHTEQLLDEKHRMYSPRYWKGRVMAPSALMFYVGFDKPIEGVQHHTLFFDTDFDEHSREIYDHPGWPEDPLFYASFSSKSDDTVAPLGKEAAVFLIPLAPDLEDTPAQREMYFDRIIERLELLTGQSVRPHIEFSQSYCVSDFKKDYNSFKGNAYGLANTLRQTAFLRPRLKSKKVKNLFFTGQLTVPGPGVPPALISGKIVSDLILKENHRK